MITFTERPYKGFIATTVLRVYCFSRLKCNLAIVYQLRQHGILFVLMGCIVKTSHNTKPSECHKAYIIVYVAWLLYRADQWLSRILNLRFHFVMSFCTHRNDPKKSFVNDEG